MLRRSTRSLGRNVFADDFDIELRAISTLRFMEVLSRLLGSVALLHVAAIPGLCIATAAARGYGLKATE